MIKAYGLTKRYGDRTVVQDLDFTVRPGTVTGFLGPNGAGKSTTMRMLLGLDTPTRGRSTIGGSSYATHGAPLTQVGTLLEARSVHPGRSARNHLLALAHTHGIPRSRVEEVIALAGLTGAADRRIKGFSLGMGQRLGIAAALLGDPATVILDEPVNGLGPEGVLWIRTLLRSLAAEGRTVLVSSHLMTEMALTADHLIVIGRGRARHHAPRTHATDGLVGKGLHGPHPGRGRPQVPAPGDREPTRHHRPTRHRPPKRLPPARARTPPRSPGPSGAVWTASAPSTAAGHWPGTRQ